MFLIFPVRTALLASCPPPLLVISLVYWWIDRAHSRSSWILGASVGLWCKWKIFFSKLFKQNFWLWIKCDSHYPSWAKYSIESYKRRITNLTIKSWKCYFPFPDWCVQRANSTTTLFLSLTVQNVVGPEAVTSRCGNVFWWKKSVFIASVVLVYLSYWLSMKLKSVCLPHSLSIIGRIPQIFVHFNHRELVSQGMSS